MAENEKVVEPTVETPAADTAAPAQTENAAPAETAAAAPAAPSAAPSSAPQSGGYNNRGPRQDGDRPQRNYGPRPRRRKVCQFCIDRGEIDYKDAAKLRKFMSERGKIIPRRVTGTCARHQREMTTAIKRARQIALLPYVSD